MDGTCCLWVDLPLGMDGAAPEETCEREVEVGYDVGSTGWGEVGTPDLRVTVESAIVLGAWPGDPLDGCGYLLTEADRDRVIEAAEALVRREGGREWRGQRIDFDVRERRAA